MAETFQEAWAQIKNAGREGGLPPEIGFPNEKLPMGTPVPEGTFVSQRAMQVLPPKIDVPGGPSVGIVPPGGSNRTSIGTLVEPAVVKPLEQEPWQNTNPLKTLPQTQVVDALASKAEVEPQKAPKKKKFDLVQAILEHMWELGGEKSAECQQFYGRTETSLKKYMQQPGTIPMECVNKFLARRPGIIAEIEEDLEPHFAADGQEGWTQSLPNRGKASVMVCSPVLERPTLPFMWTLLYLAKKYELGFDVQSDTMIVRSRNMLAHRFLASNAQWSLWLDGDMAAPINNRDWYKWITGATTVPDAAAQYDVLTRLQIHQKGVVGAVYASRKFHGSLVIQPEIRPRGPEDRQLCNEIRRGTAQGLAQVDWIGFGCALVHRTVFLEVQRKFPELAPEAEFLPWRFFDTEGAMGEDEAFCRRVRQCEIPIWLDTQLVCGHVGHMCYMPEHTVGLPTA